jgi:hypothetical protein
MHKRTTHNSFVEKIRKRINHIFSHAFHKSNSHELFFLFDISPNQKCARLPQQQGFQMPSEKIHNDSVLWEKYKFEIFLKNLSLQKLDLFIIPMDGIYEIMMGYFATPNDSDEELKLVDERLYLW